MLEVSQVCLLERKEVKERKMILVGLELEGPGGKAEQSLLSLRYKLKLI